MSSISDFPASNEEKYTEWKNWQESDFGQPTDSETRYFDAEIGRRIPDVVSASLLEIGFGNGSLLGWARTQFQSVAGVEQNKLLIERARNAGYAAHDSIDAYPAEPTYDVIAAMDVLEHMSSPEIEHMLDAVALRLKPRGCFIARFPNGDSPFGRINQNGDVTHVNAIGCMKMVYLAERAKLKLEYIAAPALTPEVSLKGKFKQNWGRGMRFVVEKAVASLYLPHRMTFDMNYLAVLRK
jgi:SAM-dependent methyltransferase